MITDWMCHAYTMYTNILIFTNDVFVSMFEFGKFSHGYVVRAS